jgi:hypothetical protein
MGTETQDPQAGNSIGFWPGCCCGAGGHRGSVTGLRPDEELSYSLGGRAEYSDNIGRVAQGKQDETTVAVDASIDFTRTTSRLETRLNAELSYNEYLNNSFDSQVRGNGMFEAEAQILEDRLAWFLNDNFGQLRQDTLSPDTPANRENVNSLRTGPRYTQNLGSRTRLLLEGTYELETYEISPLDASSVGGEAVLRHDLTRRQYVSATTSTRRYTFDDEGAFDDYDITQYYATWAAEGAKTRLQIEAGQSKLSTTGRNDSSLLLHVDASRDIGRRGELSLVARSETANTTEAFRIDQGAGPLTPGTQPRAGTADPFDIDYASLTYSLTGRRLGVSAGVIGERDRYRLTTSNDRDRRTARVSVSWVAGPSWRLGFGGDWAREEFPVTNAQFREVSYYANADRQLTRDLSLQFGAGRTDRSGVVGTNTYDENTAYISLVYSGGRARAGVGAN